MQRGFGMTVWLPPAPDACRFTVRKGVVYASSVEGRIEAGFRWRFRTLLALTGAKRLEFGVELLLKRGRERAEREGVVLGRGLAGLYEETRAKVKKRVEVTGSCWGNPPWRLFTFGHPPRFLCDASLGGLARWLRAAGYEASVDDVIPGHRLPDEALRRNQVLLTTDSEVLLRRIVVKGSLIVVWVPSALTMREQLRMAMRDLGLGPAGVALHELRRAAGGHPQGGCPREDPAPHREVAGRVLRLRRVRRVVLAGHALGAHRAGAGAGGGGVKRGLLVNLSLSLVVSLVFMAALEGLARVVERAKPAPPEREVADYIWDWDAKMPGGFYVMRSEAVGWPPYQEFNGDGLRDRTRAHEKAPGFWRVAVLGDSVTLGADLKAYEAYPQLLEARLQAEGRRMEVMNVGLWGWSTRQERIAWHRIARGYDPDQAILAVCLNDIPELHNNLTRPPGWVVWLHRRSALVRLLVNAEGREIENVERLFLSPDDPRVLEAMEGFFEEVRTLRREVEADGAEFAMVVFPFRFQVSEGAPVPGGAGADHGVL